MDGGAEHVDVHGGRLFRGRHRQAAPPGGQALHQHRQELHEDRHERHRGPQRHPDLLRQRAHEEPPAPPDGAAGALPEVPLGVPRDQAGGVPAVLLRVGPHPARDPLAGVGPAEGPGPLPVRAVRLADQGDVRQGRPLQDARDVELPGGDGQVRGARDGQGQHRGLAPEPRRRHAAGGEAQHPAGPHQRQRHGPGGVHLQPPCLASSFCGRPTRRTRWPRARPTRPSCRRR